jgi:ribosome biogenesis GTPase A
MAIEAQVVVQIVDIIAPEGTPIDVLVPLGKAKLDTTIEEARSDIMEQMDEAGREINPT